MPKSYEQLAEEGAAFLTSPGLTAQSERNGARGGTHPLRQARLIPIERIRPDPSQPRKTFNPESLKSLARSIQELGDIIDPVTVQYDEGQDHFRILSGERRYRAAQMVDLERLPCIIKESNEKQTFLLQLVANLQREDLEPVEQSAAIRQLIERFGYSQTRVAEVLNKSKSYVSQMMGLARLSPSAQEKVQTSEIPKEIQIHASREKDPQRQLEILQLASEEGKTVRQIRAEGRTATPVQQETPDSSPLSGKDVSDNAPQGQEPGDWTWSSDGGLFVVTIRFRKKPLEADPIQAVRAALEKTLKDLSATEVRGNL